MRDLGVDLGKSVVAGASGEHGGLGGLAGCRWLGAWRMWLATGRGLTRIAWVEVGACKWATWGKGGACEWATWDEVGACEWAYGPMDT